MRLLLSQLASGLPRFPRVPHANPCGHGPDSKRLKDTKKALTVAYVNKNFSATGKILPVMAVEKSNSPVRAPRPRKGDIGLSMAARYEGYRAARVPGHAAAIAIAAAVATTPHGAPFSGT